MFHFVASTGRTATTYMASYLNGVPGVTACHEGYVGSDKSTEPVLPLINLENALSASSLEVAASTVATKRNPEILNQALTATGAEVLIDVAYYNSAICAALLQSHPTCKMVGIIRELEGFVRSAVTLHGEDPMPVGWPAPEKELSEREKFIALGRMRPGLQSADRKAWKSWGAIERNIWLWQETNLLLTRAKTAFPDRVILLDFAEIKSAPNQFWNTISDHFGLSFDDFSSIDETQVNTNRNAKNTPYQIGEVDTWSEDQRRLFRQAIKKVNEARTDDRSN